jgi:hypothetical protein
MTKISLITNWPGPAKSRFVHEFLDTVEGATIVGRWSDADVEEQIAVLKVPGTVKCFIIDAMSRILLGDLKKTRNISRYAHRSIPHFGIANTEANRGRKPARVLGQAQDTARKQHYSWSSTYDRLLF